MRGETSQMLQNDKVIIVSSEELKTLKHEHGIESDELVAITAAGFKDLVHGVHETTSAEGVRSIMPVNQALFNEVTDSLKVLG
jgi:hypothetical protein